VLRNNRLGSSLSEHGCTLYTLLEELLLEPLRGSRGLLHELLGFLGLLVRNLLLNSRLQLCLLAHHGLAVVGWHRGRRRRSHTGLIGHWALNLRVQAASLGLSTLCFFVLALGLLLNLLDLALLLVGVSLGLQPIFEELVLELSLLSSRVLLLILIAGAMAFLAMTLLVLATLLIRLRFSQSLHFEALSAELHLLLLLGLLCSANLGRSALLLLIGASLLLSSLLLKGGLALLFGSLLLSFDLSLGLSFHFGDSLLLSLLLGLESLALRGTSSHFVLASALRFLLLSLFDGELAISLSLSTVAFGLLFALALHIKGALSREHHLTSALGMQSTLLGLLCALFGGSNSFQVLSVAASLLSAGSGGIVSSSSSLNLFALGLSSGSASPILRSNSTGSSSLLKLKLMCLSCGGLASLDHGLSLGELNSLLAGRLGALSLDSTEEGLLSLESLTFALESGCSSYFGHLRLA